MTDHEYIVEALKNVIKSMENEIEFTNLNMNTKFLMMQWVQVLKSLQDRQY